MLLQIDNNTFISPLAIDAVRWNEGRLSIHSECLGGWTEVSDRCVGSVAIVFEIVPPAAEKPD